MDTGTISDNITVPVSHVLNTHTYSYKYTHKYVKPNKYGIEPL